MISIHKYSSEEVDHIATKLSAYILSKPFILQAEGVFRVSGDINFSKEIIENILRYNAFSNDKYSIYDYLESLKTALLNLEIPSLQDHNDIVNLKKILASDSSEEGKEILNAFIEKLISSSKDEEFHLGKALYNFLHIAKHATIFSKKNKMTADNMGIVMGPSFSNLLESDPYKNLYLTQRLSKITSLMIIDDTYLSLFETKYKDIILERLTKWKKELEIQKLALIDMRSMSADKVIDLQDKIEEASKMIGKRRRGIRLSNEAKLVKGDISQKKGIIIEYKKDDRTLNLPKLRKTDNQIHDVDLQLFSLSCEKPLLVHSYRSAKTIKEDKLEQTKYPTLNEMITQKRKARIFR